VVVVVGVRLVDSARDNDPLDDNDPLQAAAAQAHASSAAARPNRPRCMRD